MGDPDRARGRDWVRVHASGRLHFGFLNLSLAHERLYGGLGLALQAPTTVVTARSADGVTVTVDEDSNSTSEDIREVAAEYARLAVDVLAVSGATITIEESLPRHAGLGSGTQLALATYGAVACAHDFTPDVRAHAPALGRGGRSGVGVATFERGGFVLDAGHPTERFTTDRPPRGEWTVPAVAAHHDVPENWRFVIVLPDVPRGRSGAEEDASVRAAVERADPAITEDISGLVTRQVLPAIAEGDREQFGRAVAAVGRLNGAWFADEQGGVYRPPVGAIVDALRDDAAISGAGQSSWGPAVYGVTDSEQAEAAADAGRTALAAADVEGDVAVAAPRNVGARIERKE